jgi:hypothetical protein
LPKEKPILDSNQEHSSPQRSGFSPAVIAAFGAACGQVFLIVGLSEDLKELDQNLFRDGHFTGPGWALFTLMIFGVVAGFIGLVASSNWQIPALIAFGLNLVLFLTYLTYFLSS